MRTAVALDDGAVRFVERAERAADVLVGEDRSDLLFGLRRLGEREDLPHLGPRDAARLVGDFDDDVRLVVRVRDDDLDLGQRRAAAAPVGGGGGRGGRRGCRRRRRARPIVGSIEFERRLGRVAQDVAQDLVEVPRQVRDRLADAAAVQPEARRPAVGRHLALGLDVRDGLDRDVEGRHLLVDQATHRRLGRVRRAAIGLVALVERARPRQLLGVERAVVVDVERPEGRPQIIREHGVRLERGVAAMQERVHRVPRRVRRERARRTRTARESSEPLGLAARVVLAEQQSQREAPLVERDHEVVDLARSVRVAQPRPGLRRRGRGDEVVSNRPAARADALQSRGELGLARLEGRGGRRAPRRERRRVEAR
mmetsp:Transcript_10513/g.42506  ORF Transcript_10513/g.42506 Transcript_10513/m.42506 type:complete len:369 (+) Transcript_10513:514-1620(+)